MKYNQGKYTPKYPEKYVGDVTNICYRSGWEKKLFLWVDENPSILKWGSETLIIPYISPVDNRQHRYFTDMIIQYKTSKGEIKKAVIEVKPDAQTRMPKQPKRQTQRFLTEVKTFAVNQAKWSAARAWCKLNGFEFHLITEFELGLAKRQ